LVDANVDGPWLPANHQVAAKYMGRNQLILASSATPVPLKNWKGPLVVSTHLKFQPLGAIIY